MNKILERSRSLTQHEPVPGNFWIKKSLMDIFLSFTSLCGKGLEVGCGCGITAAYLSTLGEVVAIDLPDYDAKTHSIGLSVPKNLIEALGISNVTFVACSAENMPFPDDTFDYVHCESVLEHIKNKEKALREMLRVVKPGGKVIFGVPTYIQSLCCFIHLPLYIIKRILEVIYTKIFKKELIKKTLLPMESDTRYSGAILKRFFANHPSLPLPMPHGEYKNIFEEMTFQIPYKWERLAKDVGGIDVEGFAYIFLPTNILEVFSTRFIAWLYHKTIGLHKFMGKTWLKYFAYGYCVVFRKNKR